MGPNDTELVRAFTRRVGARVADITFPDDQDFEVVVDAEAGSAVISGGDNFSTNIVVQDITDNTIIPATPSGAVSGDVGDPEWPNPDQVFEYTVLGTDLTGKRNHVCQVIAWLTVGKNPPDASFAVSSLFIITQP